MGQTSEWLWAGLHLVTWSETIRTESEALLSPADLNVKLMIFNHHTKNIDFLPNGHLYQIYWNLYQKYWIFYQKLLKFLPNIFVLPKILKKIPNLISKKYQIYWKFYQLLIIFFYQ